VVEGPATAERARLQFGDNALRPYAGAYEFTAGQEAVVLVTDKFGSLEK